MNRISIGVIGLAAFVSLIAGCAQGNHGMRAGVRDGVFVHLKSPTSDDHSLMMGLKMASLMAESQDVLIYVDVAAIPIVTRNGPDLHKEGFGSSRNVIRALLDEGVGIYACPSCLEAHGQTPMDLIAGVKVAERAAFFRFTRGRILTLDY